VASMQHGTVGGAYPPYKIPGEFAWICELYFRCGSLATALDSSSRAAGFLRVQLQRSTAKERGVRGLLFAFMMAMGTLGVIAAAPLFSRVPVRNVSVEYRPAVAAQVGGAGSQPAADETSL
jgi:hypothetical protein